jgi:endogenous inhibitor of DNA gyrase (YacG/DUF329 family)
MRNLVTERWSVAGYATFLAERPIELTYIKLQYDYASEIEFQTNGHFCEERCRFIELFQWAKPPDSDGIKRILNQTNSYYAEKWAIANAHVAPTACPAELATLILFRHGRQNSLRGNHIEFGSRVDLDLLDPRRKFNLLRGIAPRLLNAAVASWTLAVDNALRCVESALYLAMALIGIHPFVDGNGRTARLVFTWLIYRWGLPKLWLAEANDGEFLRVGAGTDSTEYLMGQFILSLSGGHNRVKHGFAEEYSDREETEALSSLQQHLADLNQDAPFFEPRFAALFSHMQQNHHFRTESPRFECLKVILHS